MFEIITGRTWDGRYSATVPGLHPAIAAVKHNLQDAMRAVQVEALRYAADKISAGVPLPADMQQWFHVVSDGATTNVGGVKIGAVPDNLLMYTKNNVIPAKPKTVWTGHASLPRIGSQEYHDLMASLNKTPVVPTPAPAPAQAITPVSAAPPSVAPAHPPAAPAPASTPVPAPPAPAAIVPPAVHVTPVTSATPTATPTATPPVTPSVTPSVTHPAAPASKT